MASATDVAELLRTRIAALEFTNLKVTSSFGASCGNLGAGSCQDLLDQADKGLYFSKHNGRNRVTRWDHVPIDFKVAEHERNRSTPAAAELLQSSEVDTNIAQLVEVVHEIIKMSVTAQRAHRAVDGDVAQVDQAPGLSISPLGD